MKAAMITVLTTVASAGLAFQEDASTADFVPTAPVRPRGLLAVSAPILGLIALLVVALIAGAAMFLMPADEAPVANQASNKAKAKEQTLDEQLDKMDKEHDAMVKKEQEKERNLMKIQQEREQNQHKQKNLQGEIIDKKAVVEHLAQEVQKSMMEKQKELGKVMQIMNNGQQRQQNRAAHAAPLRQPMPSIPAPAQAAAPKKNKY